MITIDFSKCKSATAVKNAVRDVAFSEILAIFTEHFGADDVSIVGNAEIAVAITTAMCKDGTENEVCFTIKPIIKDFDNRITASGKSMPAYERLIEADTYENDKTEKERKAEEKARLKAEKIERDKKARAERKAKAEAERRAKDEQSMNDNG